MKLTRSFWTDSLLSGGEPPSLLQRTLRRPLSFKGLIYVQKLAKGGFWCNLDNVVSKK